jgi:hypothetical protein
MKIKSVVYGEGGFDESKPNNNIIETNYYTDAELVELEAAAQTEGAKIALLERLGLTAEDLKALGL